MEVKDASNSLNRFLSNKLVNMVNPNMTASRIAAVVLFFMP
jgi:hypothetical protein